MGQFYLDLETTGFDFEKDKIISIQIQEINSIGQSIADLMIYKEWETSEAEIIKKFHRLFIVEGAGWGFIPIGYNLIFDLSFLWAKFKKYNLPIEDLSKFLYAKPLIDIKHTLIMINGLNFKGSGLDQMTNKKTSRRIVPELYAQKNYKEIEEYIIQETKSFLEFFEKCNKHLYQLKK